jgi:hypothetical protein
MAIDFSSVLAVECRTEVPLPLSEGIPDVILVSVPVFVVAPAVLLKSFTATLEAPEPFALYKYPE